jgi:hypothetical protein
MLHQFNASFQYEPFQTWLFEVSLSGARGRDLASLNMNQNQLPFQAALDGKIAQTDRKFPKINAPVYVGKSFATSSYNAVNFKVEKRYSAGLNFLANYTIQKNIESNGAGPCAYSQSAGSSVALDPYNMWRERAVAPIDVAQILIVNYGYELPWGPGKRWLSGRGAVSKILGGWQVNGITSLRSGFPSDVGTNVLPPLYGFFNVPDRVIGQSVQVQDGRGPDHFFNPNAFTVPGTTPSKSGTPVQLYGNSGRYVLRGPGSVNFDFSIFKEAAITERYKMQFRSEFFNLTNTPTFFLPAASNLALTCVGPPGSACNRGNPNFGLLANGTATGRQIQFGLKFLF